MTRIIAALAGFLLAVGASVALSTAPVEGAPTTPDGPETVDAPVGVVHNFDNNSTYLCAALRLPDHGVPEVQPGPAGRHRLVRHRGAPDLTMFPSGI